MTKPIDYIKTVFHIMESRFCVCAKTNYLGIIIAQGTRNETE